MHDEIFTQRNGFFNLNSSWAAARRRLSRIIISFTVFVFTISIYRFLFPCLSSIPLPKWNRIKHLLTHLNMFMFHRFQESNERGFIRDQPNSDAQDNHADHLQNSSRVERHRLEIITQFPSSHSGAVVRRWWSLVVLLFAAAAAGQPTSHAATLSTIKSRYCSKQFLSTLAWLGLVSLNFHNWLLMKCSIESQSPSHGLCI